MKSEQKDLLSIGLSALSTMYRFELVSKLIHYEINNFYKYTTPDAAPPPLITAEVKPSTKSSMPFSMAITEDLAFIVWNPETLEILPVFTKTEISTLPDAVMYLIQQLLGISLIETDERILDCVVNSAQDTLPSKQTVKMSKKRRKKFDVTYAETSKAILNFIIHGILATTADNEVNYLGGQQKDSHFYQVQKDCTIHEIYNLWDVYAEMTHEKNEIVVGKFKVISNKDFNNITRDDLQWEEFHQTHLPAIFTKQDLLTPFLIMLNLAYMGQLSDLIEYTKTQLHSWFTSPIDVLFHHFDDIDYFNINWNIK